jgi:cytochrome c551/c552
MRLPHRIDAPVATASPREGGALKFEVGPQKRDLFAELAGIGGFPSQLARHIAMGRTDAWIKIKNPAAPAAQREREIDWAKR